MALDFKAAGADLRSERETDPATPVAAPEPGKPGKLDFREAGAQLKADGQQALASSAMNAVETKPDEWAEARSLERKTGVPAAAIAWDLPGFRKKAQVQELSDLRAVGGVRTANVFTDPDFAKLSHDEVNRILEIEKALAPKGSAFRHLRPMKGPKLADLSLDDGLVVTIKNLYNNTETIKSGLRDSFVTGGILKPLAGAGQAFSEFLGKAEKRGGVEILHPELQAEESRVRAWAKASADASAAAYERAHIRETQKRPEFESWVAQGIYGGLESVVQLAPATVASIVTGTPVPVLTLIGAQTFGRTYGDLRADGVDADVALLTSTVVSGVEVGTELIPAKTVIKGFGKVGAGKLAKRYAASEFIGEQIATHTEDFLTDVFAKGESLQKYQEGRLQATVVTAIATATQIGVMAGAHATTRGAVTLYDRYMNDGQELGRQMHNARNSLAGLEQLDTVLKQAESSKSRERDPSAFQAAVQTIAADSGLEHVYVDGVLMQEALATGKIKPEQMSDATRDQIEDAAIFGGNVAIPLGEYAGHVVGTPADVALRQHLRVADEAMTLPEAEAFIETQAEIYEQTAAKIIAEHAVDAPFRAGLDIVEQYFRSQLQNVNRFNAAQNEAYVQMQRAFYATLARDTGTTPDAKLKEYQLKIDVAGTPVDLSLSQGAQTGLDPAIEAQTMSAYIQRKHGLPTFGMWLDPVMDEQGVATGENRLYIGKIEVPREKRGAGIGTAAMKDALDYADMRGLEVKLHPAPFDQPPGTDMGEAYTKLVKFYEKLGFAQASEVGDNFMLRRRGLDFAEENPNAGLELSAAIDQMFFDSAPDRYGMAAKLDEITAHPQFQLAMARLYEMASEGKPGEEGRPMLLLNEGDEHTPTVWLLGWRKGDMTPIHDHHDSQVAVKVVAGSVTERVYVEGNPNPQVEREFGAGGVITLPTPYTHSVGNIGSDEMGVTLHLYSPALDKMTFFEETGTELKKSGEWTAQRVPAVVKTPSPTEFSYMQEGVKRTLKDDHTVTKSTGRIFGAPAKIPAAPPGDAKAKRAQVAAMRHMRQTLHALALEGQVGKFWYENSSRAILNFFGGDAGKAATFASLIAIYSPRTSVPGNTTIALNALYQHLSGAKEIKAAGDIKDAKAMDLLFRGKLPESIKVDAFWQNLMVEIDPSQVTGGVSTMDRWMMLAFDYGSIAPAPEQYKFAEREIKNLATEFGWAPHQVQAAIWTAIKARIENHKAEIDAETERRGIKKLSREYYHLATEMGLARPAVPEEELLAAKTDFGDTLHERSAQISFESAPGKGTGVLPGLHKATAEQKAEYHAAVQKALTGPQGEDLLAEAIGLPPGTTIVGHSAWAGEVVERGGGQTFLPVHVAGLRSKRKVSVIARAKLSLLSALHGFVKTQDAVPWHHPVYDETKSNHNGIELRSTRPLTAEEMETLYERINGRFGTWDIAPGYTSAGARILNFTDIPNAEYQKGMQEVIDSLPNDFGGGLPAVGVYRSDGEYISNDWTENRDGEAYLEILARGGPDLLGRARELRGRVETVNARFAEKYGWNGKTFEQATRRSQSVSGGEAGAAGAGDAGARRREALGRVPEGYSRRVGSDTPVFSARRGKFPIAAVGYHYGNTPGLTALDGNRFGTGAPAHERGRISSFATSLNKRVYFYIGQQDGVIPPAEAIASAEGTHLYRAVVDNMYDFDADPENLIGRLREHQAEAAQRGIDKSTLMEAIALNAGYDGYINRAMNALVVMGYDAVPVESLGELDKAQEKVTKEAEGDSLQQDGEARGLITLPEDIAASPTVITLLKNADFSTFVHESGHFFLEVMLNEASKPDANPAIVARVNTIMSWLGTSAESFSQMSMPEKRPMHEKFARGFEAYMMAGKAPVEGLRNVFKQFRNFMVNVYRSMTGLDVQLTEEVRGAFDRMLAAEDLIAQEENARGLLPLFTQMEHAGMTEEEFRVYQEVGRNATDEATATVERASLRDMAWTRAAHSRALRSVHKDVAAKRAKIHEEVVAALQEKPVYKAAWFFRTGEVNGEKGEGPHQLSLQKLKDMYGDHPAAPWRYIPTGRTSIVTAKEGAGLDPDVAAPLFGFQSGDQMVREILAAEPLNVLADAETDQLMLERYGDLQSPEAVKKLADAAVANDVRIRHAATELKALTRAVGSPRDLASAARLAVANMLDRTIVNEIRPNKFAVIARRASRLAQQLFAKGNIPGAAEAKRNQLVGLYGERMANEARDEVEADLKHFGRVIRSETIDRGAKDQIEKMLARFGLHTMQPRVEPIESLQDWTAKMDTLGFTPDIDARMLDESRQAPWNHLKLEEFQALDAAIRSMEHLGRAQHKLLVAGEKAEFREAVREGRTVVADNATRHVGEQRSGERGFFKGVAKLARWAGASHRKFASLIREMDGFKEGGFLWNLIVRPMNAAGDFETESTRESRVKMLEILTPLTKRGKLTKKIHIEEIGKSFTREEIIGIALNMGNSINRERVLSGEKTRDGRKWTEQHLNAVLDKLDANDWQTVQKVWDYIGTFRAQIAAKQKRVNGTEPKWVEAEPVVTKFGVLKGGYYPIKYDPERSERSDADDASTVQKQMERGYYTRTQTLRGHLEERVKSTGRPMRYDFLHVLQTHVSQVIHDLAWHEFLIDANRLIGANGMAETIREFYGPEVQRAMSNTLRDIAVGHYPAMDEIDMIFRHLNKGTAIAGLGWNLVTALQQPLGLTQSIQRIGAWNLLRGMGLWLGNAVTMQNKVAEIYEKSTFMRNRGDTMQREVNELLNTIGRTGGAIQASYFYFIQAMQMVADIPTWLGQYDAMVREGRDEKTAVALADQAVIDSQGSGLIKDLAGVQRGSDTKKIFTVFYSFFNTTANLLAEEHAKVRKNPLTIARLVPAYLLLVIAPATGAWLLKEALKGGGDWPDDEEKLMEKLITENASYLMNTVVGLREIGQTIVGFRDYQGPAGTRFFASFAKFLKQVSQGELDEALVRAARETAGPLLKIPNAQFLRLWDAIRAKIEGEDVHPLSYVGGVPQSQKQ